MLFLSLHIYYFHICCFFIFMYIYSHIFALILLYMCVLVREWLEKKKTRTTERKDEFILKKINSVFY